jgi:hypothetical protein
MKRGDQSSRSQGAMNDASIQPEPRKARLEALMRGLSASPRLGRDECGDWAINGRLGHIFSDGAALLLYVTTEESVRRWNNIKHRLDFCCVVQDGDDEGCLQLDRMPAPTEAGRDPRNTGHPPPGDDAHGPGDDRRHTAAAGRLKTGGTENESS